MKELLEKILSKIKKTPADTQAYEDLYHIAKLKRIKRVLKKEKLRDRTKREKQRKMQH